MFRGIDMSPVRSGGEGFVVGHVDLFRVVGQMAVAMARYNKRRVNTGLSQDNWSKLLNVNALAELGKTWIAMGNVTDRKIEPGAFTALGVQLSSSINMIAEEVPLMLDGPRGSKIEPGTVNPNGGLATFAKETRAFSSLPGSYAYNGLIEGGPRDMPSDPMGSATLNTLADHVGVLTMAHSLAKTQGIEAVYGPSIFPKENDPRNRIPGMVDGQRAINIQMMGFICKMQPALVLLHSAWRFLFNGDAGVSPVREYLETRLDRHSIDSIQGKLAEVCKSFPLLPIYAEALRLVGWSRVVTKWGEMDACVLPTEFSSVKDPASSLLSEGAPFLKLLIQIYGDLKSQNVRETYQQMAVHLGAVQPSGSMAAVQPLRPKIIYSDGLHVSAKPADFLDLLMTPMFKANVHMTASDERPQAVSLYGELLTMHDADPEAGNFDANPYLSVPVQAGDDDGAVHELGTPASWLVLNGAYQGDLATTVVDGTLSGFAEALGISREELEASIVARPSRWSHLFSYDATAKKIATKYPEQRIFRSIRSSEWWRRGLRVQYLGPAYYERWVDGVALSERTGMSRSAYMQNMQWHGIVTPEIPDLSGSLDDVLNGLYARLGVIG